MAPLLFRAASNALHRRRDAFPGVKSQWQNPGDLFSILLIIGGDIVQRAIAQLSASPFVVPVAFSFGWVSYAVAAVVSVIGDGKLMPEVDCPSIVVNAKSGYQRTNQSWILGRILRDWSEEELTAPDGSGYALVVTTCEQTTKEAAKPDLDVVWYSGVATIIAQIVISIIPGKLYGSWTVLVITAGGTLVCLAQSALPQWSAEKYSCRRIEPDKKKTVALTQGNGSNHVLVITSTEGGLDLEDLAGARKVWRRSTLPCTLVLALFWFVILLTAIAVEEHTWFFLLIGGMGIVQNVFAAGYKRKPAAFGIHVQNVCVIKPKRTIDPATGERDPTNKVFWVLQQAEEASEGLGLSLLPIFFPGELRSREVSWRDETVAANKARAAARKAEEAARKGQANVQNKIQ